MLTTVIRKTSVSRCNNEKKMEKIVFDIDVSCECRCECVTYTSYKLLAITCMPNKLYHISTPHDKSKNKHDFFMGKLKTDTTISGRGKKRKIYQSKSIKIEDQQRKKNVKLQAAMQCYVEFYSAIDIIMTHDNKIRDLWVYHVLVALLILFLLLLEFSDSPVFPNHVLNNFTDCTTLSPIITDFFCIQLKFQQNQHYSMLPKSKFGRWLPLSTFVAGYFPQWKWSRNELTFWMKFNLQVSDY